MGDSLSFPLPPAKPPLDLPQIMKVMRGRIIRTEEPFHWWCFPDTEGYFVLLVNCRLKKTVCKQYSKTHSATRKGTLCGYGESCKSHHATMPSHSFCIHD